MGQRKSFIILIHLASRRAKLRTRKTISQEKKRKRLLCFHSQKGPHYSNLKKCLIAVKMTLEKAHENCAHVDIYISTRLVTHLSKSVMYIFPKYCSMWW